MNKKGFTLVELLAVIVILAVVATIAMVSVGASRDKVLKGMVYEKISEGKAAAEKLGATKEYSEYLEEDNYYVTFDDLLKTGIYESEETIIGEDGKEKVDILNIFNSTQNNSMLGLKFCLYRKYNRIYSCIENSPENLVYVAGIDEDTEVTKFYCEETIKCPNSLLEE